MDSRARQLHKTSNILKIESITKKLQLIEVKSIFFSTESDDFIGFCDPPKIWQRFKGVVTAPPEELSGGVNGFGSADIRFSLKILPRNNCRPLQNTFPYFVSAWEPVRRSDTSLLYDISDFDLRSRLFFLIKTKQVTGGAVPTPLKYYRLVVLGFCPKLHFAENFNQLDELSGVLKPSSNRLQSTSSDL